MWITDLVKASKAVENFLEENKWYVTIKKVAPCWGGGIGFEMSDFTFIKWFQDGRIERQQIYES